MPVQLPTGCVLSWTPTLVPGPTRSESAFGTNRQHFIRLGRHWRFDVTLQTMLQTKANEWILLNTETDSVLWDIPQGSLINGTEGTPVVNGASQVGTTLDVDGLTPGFVIPQGAFISVITSSRRYVYQVRTSVTASTSSPTGQAAIAINPPLRVSPGDGDTVEIESPKVEGYVDFSGKTYTRRSDNLVRGFSFTVAERG
jgi:hypothetical protein